MSMPEVPDIYEQDYREVLIVLDSLKYAIDTHDQLENAYVLRMEVTVSNGHGYTIGTLFYEDEQWRFVPYADWAQ